MSVLFILFNVQAQPSTVLLYVYRCVGYSNCELRLVRERGSNVKGRAEKRGTDTKEGTMGNKERNLHKGEAQWNGKKGKEKEKWEKTKRRKIGRREGRGDRKRMNGRKHIYFTTNYMYRYNLTRNDICYAVT